jgi:hypothetical protein
MPRLPHNCPPLPMIIYPCELGCDTVAHPCQYKNPAQSMLRLRASFTPVFHHYSVTTGSDACPGDLLSQYLEKKCQRCSFMLFVLVPASFTTASANYRIDWFACVVGPLRAHGRQMRRTRQQDTCRLPSSASQRLQIVSKWKRWACQLLLVNSEQTAWADNAQAHSEVFDAAMNELAK